MKTPILPRVARFTWRRALAFALAGILSSVALAADRVMPDFAAIAREAVVNLPAPPPWPAVTPPATWSIDELQAELAKFTNTPPRVNMLRTRLVRPDHRWAVELARWFRRVQKQLQIRYREQSWDCDDYANCFVAFADLLMLKAGGEQGGLCVGRASVYYRKPFAGIRAGAAHALVILGTSNGLFLVEPQDGTMVSLRDFPNRNTIEEANF